MRSLSRTFAAAALAAALLPLAPSAATVAADPAVTIRLATPESPNRPSQTFLDTFVSAVETASAGSIAVDVIYQAGGGDDVAKESITAQRVLSGDVEMAVIPLRAWGDAGVTAFDALAAPLLIDNDALAVAIATDPLVQPMLDAIGAQGLVGLAVWPEDLRHPFTFERNGYPLLGPADYAGQTIFALQSKLQAEILGALGATVTTPTNLDKGVRDGTIRGAESGLWVGGYTLGGMPTATIDVTLYPKWQTLVAEDAAWSRLTAEQQAVVHDAAAAAQAAELAVRPTDADSAAAYCAAGGRVVVAGYQNVDAIRAAEQPVVDRLSSDPAAATAFAAIEALSKATPRGPAPAPCGPKVDVSATTPPVKPGPPIAPIPDGVYTMTLTAADLRARGTTALTAGNNEGAWTLTVDGGDGSWTLLHPSGSLERCDVTFAVRKKDRVRMAPKPSCPQPWTDLRWTLEGDQLRIDVLDDESGLLASVREDEAILGGPWTRIE